MTRLLTAEELAAELGVRPSWVTAKAADGTIPSLKLGKYRRYELDAVLAALRKADEGKAA